MRLLVLGSGNQREHAFHAWARAGIDVTLVDGAGFTCYEPLVRDYLPWDVRDYVLLPDDGGLIDTLVKLAREHDGVTTLSDDAQIVTATVAQRCGQPGTGVRAAELARDKGEQRELTGVPAVRHCRSTDPAEIASFVDRTGACVVKPAGAGGSASVHLVRDGAQALAACAAIQAARGAAVVAEEFLTGPEVSVECVIADGRLAHAFVTTKEIVGAGCFLERQHLVARAPERSADAVAAAAGLIGAFGVENAVAHAEIKFTEHGPVPIEMAVRPAGDRIPELGAPVYGRDLYADLAALAFGRSLAPELASTATAAAIRFGVGTGLVEGRARPSEMVHGLPDVRVAAQLLPIGKAVTALHGNWDRACYALGATTGDAAGLGAQLRVAVDRQLAAMGLTPVGT